MAISREVRSRVGDLTDLAFEVELYIIGLITEESNANRVNFRRQIATHMVALMVNNAHGIVTLLKKENTYSTGTLIRSMLEQWVNIQYIYLTSTYVNLVRYLYDGDKMFIKNAKDFAEHAGKFNKDDDLTPFIEDSLASIKYRVSSSNDLKKYGYPLKKMEPLLDRVKLIDKHNSNISMVFLYYYDYVEYSRHVHTTKDKLIEMTYAESYDDWFQANSISSIEYKTLQMINASGELLEFTVTFLAKKTRKKMREELREIIKNKNYTTHMGEYLTRKEKKTGKK
ncbi:hypothetical protein A3F64_01470 [Candidatus Saccharibacteria bacterium RIFCSPHIGHO2_12_FULL_42_8]|nr:MAG: hypothetical protein A3F64_01470 [Candidatus Saccharibacteria bacterium RIFCSPHIGHO2_12_FULL_42_8]